MGPGKFHEPVINKRGGGGKRKNREKKNGWKRWDVTTARNRICIRGLSDLRGNPGNSNEKKGKKRRKGGGKGGKSVDWWLAVDRTRAEGKRGIVGFPLRALWAARLSFKGLKTDAARIDKRTFSPGIRGFHRHSVGARPLERSGTCEADPIPIEGVSSPRYQLLPTKLRRFRSAPTSIPFQSLSLSLSS